MVYFTHKNEYSVEEFGRDRQDSGAEGEKNSQAEGPDLDETLER